MSTTRVLKKKRLIVEVNEEFHAKIKSKALARNITIRKWLIRAILQALKQEEKYD